MLNLSKSGELNVSFIVAPNCSTALFLLIIFCRSCSLIGVFVHLKGETRKLLPQERRGHPRLKAASPESLTFWK